MTASATLPVVQADSFLTLHYRLAALGPAGEGAQIINTFADKPATLSLGTGELSPALEARLLGLAEGSRTRFELPAGEAFGPRNPDLLQWVARKLLNELGDPQERYVPAMWCNFPRPTARGNTPERCCKWAPTVRCNLTSITPWQARPWCLRCR